MKRLAIVWPLFIYISIAFAASAQNEANIIHIGPNGLAMPLDRIILVRKDNNCCAVKFTKFWEDTKGGMYSQYESYSFLCKSGSGKLDAKFKRKELRNPEPSFSIFGHPIAIGTVDEIDCGPFSLWWSGLGSVYFFEKGQREGDYGIELSPTKWTDVSQVNDMDTRLKWYRYDSKRKRTIVSVDDLW